MFIVLVLFVRPSKDACTPDFDDPTCSNKEIYNEQLTLWLLQIAFHFCASVIMTARERMKDPEWFKFVNICVTATGIFQLGLLSYQMQYLVQEFSER